MIPLLRTRRRYLPRPQSRVLLRLQCTPWPTGSYFDRKEHSKSLLMKAIFGVHRHSAIASNILFVFRMQMQCRQKHRVPSVLIFAFPLRSC
jgi:hypothetical protein